MAGQVGRPPGTTTIQVGGITFAFGNWIDDKIWGTGQFGDGDQEEILLLTSGRSEPIPGGLRKANKHDTNVPKGGLNGLPVDWEMYIFSFANAITRVMRPTDAGQVIFPDTGGAASAASRFPVVFDFDRKVYMNFMYNDTIWTQGVPQDYPQGGGYSVVSETSSFEYAQWGRPTPRDHVSLVLPVWMRDGLGYNASYQPQAALHISQPTDDDTQPPLTFIDVRFTMLGLIKKVVVGA
jgi:hypothetical protein